MGEWTDEVFSPHIMYNAVIIIIENANILQRQVFEKYNYNVSLETLLWSFRNLCVKM